MIVEQLKKRALEAIDRTAEEIIEIRDVARAREMI
jgi:hypothetical protein